jgi:hypothetical protein
MRRLALTLIVFAIFVVASYATPLRNRHDAHSNAVSSVHDGHEHAAGDTPTAATSHVANVSDHGHDHDAVTSGAAEHSSVHGEDDQVALADMDAYVARHFGATLHHDSAHGAAADWDLNFELRWADYANSDGTHVVRVYHATHKHDSALRYTAAAANHSASSHFEWERAH